MTDYEALMIYAKEYVEAKSQEAKIKKKVESANSAIKQFMKKLKIPECTLDDGTVLQYSIQNRESLDEDKLLIQLKHFAPDTQCIKTKEYVDMDVLESEIYHGKLSDDAMVAMDSCRIVKEIERLDIKKAKKK